MAFTERQGSIFDIGYRRYEGIRLGRGHAVRSLFFHGLRASYGLGRSPFAKVIPFGLFVIALIPAAVRLGIATAFDENIDLLAPEDYYNFVFIVVALFVAAVAPELVSRDQRNRTLVLYFSRAIQPSDYALAKLGALVVATLGLTLVPLALIFIGNALSRDEPWTYVTDEWPDIPRIVLAGLASSLFLSSLALAIASHSPRRAFATGGVIGFVLVATTIGNVLAETVGAYGLLASPSDLIIGTTYWIFDAPPNDEANPLSDVQLAVVALVTLAITVVSVAALLRRFRSLQS